MNYAKKTIALSTLQKIHQKKKTYQKKIAKKKPLKQKTYIPFKLMEIYEKNCQRLQVKPLKNEEEKNR